MFRTLIVEDEAVIRRGLIATFDWLAAGCVVVGEARDGTEGLEMIRKLQPDLVISDISMPGMSGLAMIEEAQKECHFHSILLTGYSEFEFARCAVSLHVHAYLMKPINRDELMQSILALPRKEEAAPAQEAIHPDFPVSEGFDVISSQELNYYVRYVVDAIQTRYAEKLQLETLADELFVSKSYLSRKLQEETSHSFTELLYQFRLQKALELLDEGRYRVSEVAALCGFHDYKHFNAVVNKHIHMTPSEYLSADQRIVFRR